MSHLEVPRFPRGFLLSERPVDAPPGYVPGPLLPNFWVHPWTNVEHAGDRELFVIIIGHAVPTTPGQVQQPSEHLLACLRNDEGTFLKALDDYGGRHAIIFGRAGNVGVVNDATAMRSVFYAADGGVIASHALLVEQALGGDIVFQDLPVKYGYPGNRTPYSRTKTLTANTYYWMTANLVRRFWPLVRLAPRTVEEAAAKLLERSTHALRVLAKGRSVKMTLTAGLDSRTIYAIALHSGVPFSTYTHGDGQATLVDRLLAEELAEKFGIRHTVIGSRTESEVLFQRLQEVNYLNHHMSWVEALIDYYSDRESVAVVGNALEIGRSNTMLHRQAAGVEPVTAEGMALLHHRRMNAGKRKRVDELGYDQFMGTSISAFQEFIDDTGYDIVSDYMNPFDLFYWEHRMATWQGHAMNERDFYSVPFIPFNTRFVYETMLGVPEGQRYADEIAYCMINMVDPGILELPINPKSWSRQPVPVTG